MGVKVQSLKRIGRLWTPVLQSQMQTPAWLLHDTFAGSLPFTCFCIQHDQTFVSSAANGSVTAGVPAPFARSPLLMAALAAELGCHQVMSNTHPGITGTTSCKDTAAEKLRALAPVPGQYRP